MIKEKANIAVFISGRGTNLKALILRSKKRKCNWLQHMKQNYGYREVSFFLSGQI